MNKKKIGVTALALLTLTTITTGCGKTAKLKTDNETVVALKNSKITANALYKELKKNSVEKLIDMIDHKLFDKKYPSDDTEKKSIDEFSWLGRFTQLKRPYKVILDGAHNMDGIQALVKSISKWDGDIYFSALSDKDVEEMLKILETLHCPITLVSIDSYRCYPLETLSYPLISKEELIERINHPVTDMLICGSLYFIGEVLEKVDG